MANTVSRRLSDATLSRIIQIESSGKPTIKASTSSATGLFQFISATWLNVVRQHRPDLLRGRTQSQVLALRKNPSLAIELGARFEEANLSALGKDATEGDLYLAHFLGVGTAKNFLRAPARDRAELHCSAAAVTANRSILAGKTVGQVRAWAARRMAQSGKVDWIARWYNPDEPLLHPIPPQAKREPRPVKLEAEEDEPGAAIEEPGDAGELDQDTDRGRAAEGAGDLGGDLAGNGGPADENRSTGPVARMEADDEVVTKVQQELRRLKYFDVGEVDGKWGTKVRGAILAFRADNRLPLVPRIDQQLLAALATARERPVAEDRATATAPEVANKLETVKQSWWTQVWAWIAGVPAAIAAFFQTMFPDDSFGGAVGQIKDFFAGIPKQFLWIGIAALAGAILYNATKSKKAAIDAYREGRLT